MREAHVFVEAPGLVSGPKPTFRLTVPPEGETSGYQFVDPKQPVEFVPRFRKLHMP